MRKPLKHIGLNVVGIVPRGTGKKRSRLLGVPSFFRWPGHPCAQFHPSEGRRHFCLSTMSYSKEVWEPIPGYEGHYEVSNHGRVRSLDRTANVLGGGERLVHGRVLSLQNHDGGYKQVSLCKNGDSQTVFVHRIVLQVFGSAPPTDGDYQVNHLDGDKTNNYIDNLEWCTPTENSHHAVEHGLVPNGESRHNTKLTENDVRRLRHERRENGTSYEALAEPYDVGWEAVYHAVTGSSWKHIKDPPPVEREDVHSTKLTDDQVREARRLRRSDEMAFQAIADRFGVSYSCARQAIRGETCKHITDPPPVE